MEQILWWTDSESGSGPQTAAEGGPVFQVLHDEHEPQLEDFKELVDEKKNQWTLIRYGQVFFSTQTPVWERFLFNCDAESLNISPRGIIAVIFHLGEAAVYFFLDFQVTLCP